jgi:hypothetical protein
MLYDAEVVDGCVRLSIKNDFLSIQGTFGTGYCHGIKTLHGFSLVFLQNYRKLLEILNDI